MDAGVELLAQPAGCGAGEWMVRVVEQPQARLLGIEQRAGAIDDVVEHGGQIQLAGQLLGHVAQGTRAAHLAPGASQDLGVQDVGPIAPAMLRRKASVIRRASLRVVLQDQLTDPFARGAQGQLGAGAVAAEIDHPRIARSGVERGRRRLW